MWSETLLEAENELLAIGRSDIASRVRSLYNALVALSTLESRGSDAATHRARAEKVYHGVVLEIRREYLSSRSARRALEHSSGLVVRAFREALDLRAGPQL